MLYNYLNIGDFMVMTNIKTPTGHMIEQRFFASGDVLKMKDYYDHASIPKVIYKCTTKDTTDKFTWEMTDHEMPKFSIDNQN
jgi:hypothetical protein